MSNKVNGYSHDSRMLEFFDDRQLVSELLRRGWLLKEEEHYLVDDRSNNKQMYVTADAFLYHLHTDHNTELIGGKTTRGVVQSLLNAYPGVATYKRIMFNCYGQNPNGGPDFADDTIKCTIHRLRKVLAGTPYQIGTVWGEGYRLERVEGQEIDHEAWESW